MEAWFKPNALLNMTELAEFLQQIEVQLFLKHVVSNSFLLQTAASQQNIGYLFSRIKS